MNVQELQGRLEQFGQDHLLRFSDRLDQSARDTLLREIESVDFPTVNRLIDEWVLNEPAPEKFARIEPVPVIPPIGPNRPDAREALEAGEAALRAGRVGCVVVAGGQGTRLGFDGPKGSYPIGPITKNSLFQYHAEKILNLNRRYGCRLPWYVMVSDTNAVPTQEFFRANNHFGLNAADIVFFQQKMMPCVDDSGKLMLDAPGHLAMNPNGHGGTILALVDEGIIKDAKQRGVDTLSYFQVDNWAVKVADPYFIGYHVSRGSEMSSKVHRKRAVRESVGVHCVCDGQYCVIEYSELDLYPQLLETDAAGGPVHFAGNPAIHILSTGFVERVYRDFSTFPWHRAHKKIPYINPKGELVTPEKPNGYKFETFIFDALRLCKSKPVALEIGEMGEYTPIKQFDGDNSVMSARKLQRDYWADWLDAAGTPVPRNGAGHAAHDIEISPAFAMTRDEFISNSLGKSWTTSGALAIDKGGVQIKSG